MSKPRPSAPPSAGGNAAPTDQPTFRSNPEVDAKIDAYIKENPKYWAYVQAMPRERLERTVVLNEVRELDRQQRIREGVLKQINRNPEMKRAYGERGAALGRQIASALGSELLASKFPLCERLIERSYGVLVLTRFMQRWLERRFGSMPVGKFIGRAPHHSAPPPPIAAETSLEARRLLGLPEK